jgi:hypothetical protein
VVLHRYQNGSQRCEVSMTGRLPPTHL